MEDLDLKSYTLDDFIRETVAAGDMPKELSPRLMERIRHQPPEQTIKEVVVIIVRHALEYAGNDMAQKIGVLAGVLILQKVFEVMLGDTKALKEELATLHRTIQMLEL